VSNPNGINMKLYGAGIYVKNNDIYFIGGKVGLDDE